MAECKALDTVAAALAARGLRCASRLIDLAAQRALDQQNEDAALLALVSLYAFGVHVPKCAMLHPEVHDDDWRQCNCWFGRAHDLVSNAKIPQAYA